MFEKYDGVRAFWVPEKRTFYSRNGNPLSLPQEVVDSMPADLYLDGELWFGTYMPHSLEGVNFFPFCFQTKVWGGQFRGISQDIEQSRFIACRLDQI